MGPFVSDVFGRGSPPLPSVDIAAQILSGGKSMINLVKDIGLRVRETDEAEQARDE